VLPNSIYVAPNESSLPLCRLLLLLLLLGWEAAIIGLLVVADKALLIVKPILIPDLIIITTCIGLYLYSFLTHLFFGITQDVTNLRRLYHAVFHDVLRGPRPQDVLTSESDQEPGKGLHQQSKSNLP
jgi:hypothetical protein